jgi:hypothetical protein
MNLQTWSLLNDYANRRRRFDPNNREDLKELGYFRKHGSWKSSCPFYLEWPYKDIVSMCQAKYTDFMLMKLAKK